MRTLARAGADVELWGLCPPTISTRLWPPSRVPSPAEATWTAYYPELANPTFESEPTEVPLPRDRLQQHRGVERNRRFAGVFFVAPAFYRTQGFYASCAALFVALWWAAYQFRVRQLQHEFAVRLAGRLERAIRKGDDAIAESRDAIQGLRANPAPESNIEHMLASAGKEFARSFAAKGESLVFQVTVEGARHILSPLLQDEVYRIAREILRNAFHHARASRIEAAIAYHRQFFRVRIRDNGKGIDPGVLKGGERPGHWGLPGVPERAKRIGAQLILWSEPGAGTETESTVAARIAYATAHRRGNRRLLREKWNRANRTIPIRVLNAVRFVIGRYRLRDCGVWSSETS